VRAELDVEGIAVQLVGVHLSSRLPHAPPIQLRRLARQVPAAGVPTIVAGDCNFWGPGVRALFRGWRRAVRGRTWPATRPHSQIDHVLVRPADIEVLGGRVLADVGSDHRPVRVRLRIPPGGATA
jgi:endonuclease/exonuclease/phosphatase (EEP) superfamily protein YafD